MLEPQAYLPKWFKTKVELIRAIHAGELGGVGTPFLPVRELAVKYNISLVTAQKVVTMLRDEGIIIQQGRGYVIGKMPLKTSKAKRIGLIVTMADNPFFSLLMKNVELAAARRGIEAMVASSNYDVAREHALLEMFEREKVDGVLACPANDRDSAANFNALKLPHVLIGRRIINFEADTVLVQNFSAGQAVARHLGNRGIKSFGYIGLAGIASDPRLEGFRSGLAEMGRTLRKESTILLNNNDLDAKLPALERMLKSLPRPAGIFCFHDLLAARVISSAAKLGIEIPEQLSLVGFDDLPIASELAPSLSSVAYPIDQMAEVALTALMKRLDGFSGRPMVSYLDPQLVIRESSGGSAVNHAQGIMSKSLAYNLA